MKTASLPVSLSSAIVPTLLGLLLISTLLLTLSQPAAAGKIFRWKSADGTIHYGEHPPQGVQAELMSTTTGKPSRNKRNVERVEPGEYTGEEQAAADDSDAAPEKDGAGMAPPKPKKNKEICERARYNLKVLTERARIRQTDENGEERYLTEEEKDEQKKAAQDAVDAYCP